MTKAILIDPTEMRKPGVLRVPEIPINQYAANPQAEAAQYGRDALVRIFHDMVVIREFETMLDRIKKEGVYQGIEYQHKGPAHLSIGQEASVVGQAYNLTPEDFIFGSHRSHGEILAKSLSSIAKLDDAALQQIMETYNDGDTLKIVETFHRESAGSNGGVKGLAIDYLLFGALAEIFGRYAGFNRGMGGSMHAFFPPFGVMPNNAIVGGSADIATGAALFKRVNRRPGIVIANIGDASSGCGPVWEAMMFAAMDQYRKLWPEEAGGAPPMMFNFFNNFYGMGGQPYGETMGFQVLARIGLGVNPEGMHSERVDGYNPLAVAEAIARKKQILLEGRGPVLLDTITYRFTGHSPSDASAYRTKEEVDLWRQHDSLIGYREYLVANGHASDADLDAVVAGVIERLVKVLGAAVNDELAPRVALDSEYVGEIMFTNRKRDRYAESEPWVLQKKDESRLAQTQAKFRYAFDAQGKPHPKLKTLTYAEALYEAMMEGFYRDPTMVAFGEENRDWGGAFGVYRGLTEALPYPRLFNSPISEGAIVGAAVGYALSGGRRGRVDVL